MTREEMLNEEYHRNMHAIQTGVKMRLQWDLKYEPDADKHGTSPKHLRTGVNSCLVDSGAMARLLISKGIITGEEYMQALVTETAREKAQYEAELTKRYGAQITLV